jgi:hypothetical protein
VADNEADGVMRIKAQRPASSSLNMLLKRHRKSLPGRGVLDRGEPDNAEIMKTGALAAVGRIERIKRRDRAADR